MVRSDSAQCAVLRPVASPSALPRAVVEFRRGPGVQRIQASGWIATVVQMLPVGLRHADHVGVFGFVAQRGQCRLASYCRSAQ